MNFIDFGEELLVWTTRLCGQFACEIRYSFVHDQAAIFVRHLISLDRYQPYIVIVANAYG